MSVKLKVKCRTR